MVHENLLKGGGELDLSHGSHVQQGEASKVCSMTPWDKIYVFILGQTCKSVK
jgi:hypothetical protein